VAESEMEEERDTHLDKKEREKKPAVARMKTGYTFVVERQKRRD